MKYCIFERAMFTYYNYSVYLLLTYLFMYFVLFFETVSHYV